jgi:hypothetical protein
VPFQVVELLLDADGTVNRPRGHSCPQPLETIESSSHRFRRAHYEADRDYWSAIAASRVLSLEDLQGFRRWRSRGNQKLTKPQRFQP